MGTKMGESSPLRRVSVLLACLTLACTEAVGGGAHGSGGEGADTGFYSDRLVEVGGELRGIVLVPTHETPTPSTPIEVGDVLVYEEWLDDAIHGQFEYTIRQLDEQVALNRADIEVLEVQPVPFSEHDRAHEGSAVQLEYRARISGLVERDVLDELLRATVVVTVPRYPKNFLETFVYSADEPEKEPDPVCAAETPHILYVGAECYEDARLQPGNYFFYFDPDRSLPDGRSCRDVADLTDVQLTVRERFETERTYPEYDLLLANGALEIAYFIGENVKPEHRPANSRDEDDAGHVALAEAERAIVEDLHFRIEVGDSHTRIGRRYQKQLYNGTRAEITLVGPDHVPRLEGDGLDPESEVAQQVRELVRTSDIVVYSGHSFYGTSFLFADADVFAPGKYQIFVFASCRSYGHYVDRIFANKSRGLPEEQSWAFMDIVANMGSSHWAIHSQLIVLERLIGDVGEKDKSGALDWHTILQAVNGNAERRAQLDRCDDLDPFSAKEMYGVAGARGNLYEPLEDLPRDSCRATRFDDPLEDDADADADRDLELDDGETTIVQGSIYGEDGDGKDVDEYVFRVTDTAGESLEPTIALLSTYGADYGTTFELCVKYEYDDGTVAEVCPDVDEDGYCCTAAENTRVELDVASALFDDSGKLKVRVRTRDGDARATCGWYELQIAG